MEPAVQLDQRRKAYRVRQQYEGQAKDFTELLRGGAWPSSVRIVRHPVKSGNEQDPCHSCQHTLRGDGHTVGTAAAKAEEGAGYGRSVCPESSGLHAGYNGWDNGHLHREVMVIS